MGKHYTMKLRAVSQLKSPRIPLDDAWDVIVAGGGPAGCAAAAAAAREGAKTLLIEATGALGGMGTSGLVPAWCPFSDSEKIIYRGTGGTRVHRLQTRHAAWVAERARGGPGNLLRSPGARERPDHAVVPRHG